MTKCSECKKEIKGKVAYMKAKPLCSECFKAVKEGIAQTEQSWLNKFKIFPK